MKSIIRKRPRDSSDDEKSQKEESKKNEMPSFLLKLYQILETNEYNSIIEWGDNGKYFIVKNLNEFTDKVLPKFFKHNNFSSFVRQLNMYDFHKKRNNTNENIFQHKNFIRGQKNLIKTIRRKNNLKESIINNQNDQEEELGLVEYCQRELSSKKVSKMGLEKIMTHLIKTLNETHEKQKALDSKVETLGKQNEDFIIQNQQLIQEVVNKTDYTQKLEALLLFIIEIIMPKNVYKNSENKNILGQCGGINSNIKEVFIPGNHTEFKTKAINDGNIGVNRNPLAKTVIEGGLNEKFLDFFFEKFIELLHTNNRREKMDFFRMLGSSGNNKEDDVININRIHSNINNINNTSISVPLSPIRASILPNNTVKSSPMKTYEAPKMEFDDQNSTLFRNPSPNPFLDDLNFNSTNIFGSPRNSHSENFPFFSRMPSENNKNETSESNLLSINNFNQLPTPHTRNNSMDLNELFKNNNEEGDKKLNENNYIFDDSYFSVSSDKNRSETRSEHKSNDN